MSTSAKARRVEKAAVGLSVRGIVVADLKEAHGAHSIHDHAHKLFMEGHGPTLCDRISDAVEGAMKGQDEERIGKTQRERCHEGLFLVHLAQACEFAILEHQRSEARLILALLQESEVLSLTLLREDGYDEDRWV